MLKPYSTKRPLPVPAEYRREFVAHGHDHCKKLYGKRAAQRYFVMTGPADLRAERDAYVAKQRAQVQALAEYQQRHRDALTALARAASRVLSPGAHLRC